MKAWGCAALCWLLWTDSYGPLANIPLRNVYQELRAELCPTSTLVISGRLYESVQGASGIERRYLGAGGWHSIARVWLGVVPQDAVTAPASGP